ncbi:uncharacterized protein LOC142978984 isoform X2 [Anticarsia gemmatalis]
MMSLVEEDTDDEYLDDPIKLFDFEQDRVHYGTSSLEYGKNLINQASETIKITSDTETNEVTVFKETDCIPSFVKLVDCRKFPWYFKKYTQQILAQSHVYDLVTDSDSEIDVENFDESDCFLIDDKSNEFDDISTLKTPETVKTALEKRQMTMRRNKDIEVLKALKQKNLTEVDFKRNKGLVGMVITHKIVNDKNVGQNAGSKKIKKNKRTIPKPSDTTIDDSYINAANKILNGIGTDLLPIPVNKEHTKHQQNEKTEDNKVTNEKTNGFNVPVHFSLREISEELVHRILANKPVYNKQGPVTAYDINCGQKDQVNADTPSRLYSSLNKVKPTNNVKCIKKTNKYKKSQQALKEKNKMLMAKNADILSNEKTGVDRSESHSPILHCSSLVKKFTNKIPRIGDKQKDSTDNHNLGNKSAINTNDNEAKSDPSQQIITKQTNIKPKNNANANTSRSNFVGIRVKDIASISKEIPADKKVDRPKTNPINNVQGSIIAANKTVEELNISSALTGLSNTLQIIPIKDTASSNKSGAVDTYLPKVPTSLNKPMTAKDYNNKTSLFKDIPTNTVANTTVNNVISSNSVSHTTQSYAPVYSSHTSSQFRPNLPSPPYKFEFRINQPTFNNRPRNQEPRYQMKPVFYENPYLGNFRTPLHHVNNPRFEPRSANCSVSNYRFPPPFYQKQYHYTQYKLKKSNPPPKDFEQSSTLPKKKPRKRPYQVSRQNSESSQATENRVRPNNILINTTSQPAAGSSSTPDINKDNLDKRNITDPRLPVPHSKEETVTMNAGLVTTKTKMLQILEDATKELKKGNDQSKQEPANTFKKPKILQTKPTSESKPSAEKDQQNGYSPPILPIPTYEKVLDRVISQLHDKNIPHSLPLQMKQKPGIKKNDKCSKKLFSKPQEAIKKDDTKKISLEEYKKRISKVDNNAQGSNKVICSKTEKEKQGPSVKKVGENVERFSTESDLGYDSDSTVIL